VLKGVLGFLEGQMPLRRAQLAVVALLVSALALAGCTFRPVYSGPDIDRMAWAFRYDEPATRLAMVVRDELSVHFNTSKDPSAPRLRITASQSNRGLTISGSASPNDNLQAVVTATVTAFNDSGVIFTATRSASANYQTNNQVFASKEASIEAGERAAKAAAESLRLALLANFSKFRSDL
jgi:hypothetical protein